MIVISLHATGMARRPVAPKYSVQAAPRRYFAPVKEKSGIAQTSYQAHKHECPGTFMT